MAGPTTHTQTTARTVNNTNYSIPNKPNDAARKIYRPYFYAGSVNYAHINLDSDIIQQLHLTPDTELTEEIIITPNGRRGILVSEKERV